jgi:predicted ester cyclase
MSTAENKALVRRLIEEVWNQGNLAVFDELKAFPDFHITIEDVIAEGDQVVVRLTGRGTNTGDLGAPAPHPATGKHVTITGNVIARVANDKFVEIWHQVDWLGLFQQLGLIPAPGQAS